MKKHIIPLFFVGLLPLTSCIKPPSTEIDYGPEVEVAEVASAVNEALGPADPTKINLNEYTEGQVTRLIRGRSSIDILSRTGVSVTRKELVQNQLQIYYVEDKIEYDLTGGGNDRRITRDFQECMNKDSLDPENCVTLSASSSNSVTEQKYRGQVDIMKVIRSYSEDTAKLTYHNFAIKRYLESPPELIKNYDNCMDIPNCQIHVTELSYDVVDWSTSEGSKIAIKLKISPDVPYLSRVIEKCQQGSIPIPQPGQSEDKAARYLMTFCDSVRNFRFGTATN